jgi:hypothetical protein
MRFTAHANSNDNACLYPVQYTLRRSMQRMRHAVVSVDERALEVINVDQRRLKCVNAKSGLRRVQGWRFRARILMFDVGRWTFGVKLHTVG